MSGITLIGDNYFITLVVRLNYHEKSSTLLNYGVNSQKIQNGNFNFTSFLKIIIKTLDIYTAKLKTLPRICL